MIENQQYHIFLLKKHLMSVFCEVRFSRLIREESENLARERFLRGLPISRAIAEESEIAQARPKRRVYIGA